MSPKRGRVLTAGLFAGFLLAGQPLAAAEKTDVVFLKNGDRITGEVKALEHGRLTFKTDSMSTIYIEWEDVERLTSTQNLEVELKTSEKFFGTLDPEAAAGKMKVDSGEDVRVEDRP